MSSVQPEERERIEGIINEIFDLLKQRRWIVISPTAEEYVFHLQTTEGKALLMECNEIHSDSEIGLELNEVSDYNMLLACLSISLDRKVSYCEYYKDRVDEEEDVLFTCAEDLEKLKQVLYDELHFVYEN